MGRNVIVWTGYLKKRQGSGRSARAILPAWSPPGRSHEPAVPRDRDMRHAKQHPALRDVGRMVDACA